ncbi:DciA family protein [Geopsychrobacter electrodiphilus]|uniref:DciA family protein n=1 Tax=Geopsychrobacter electrodiphilus TaxID=225196 RepID=UPI000375B299|nr:DUF721 domain-containing protein [Geopsychrobacter electrodiphilus]
MKRSERPKLKKAEAVAGLLKKLLGDTGLDDRLPRYQAWLVWDKVVGEQIARHARPLRIREKILEVRVDNPVWMQQLQMLKPQIIKKLHAELPNCDIDDIYLRRGDLQPETTTASEPTIKWQTEKLSESEQIEIEESLTGLPENDLKNEMRRLFIRQKKLTKAKSRT